MGLKLFGKSDATTLVLGASMLALVGNETATAEQVDAANQELDAAGIKGAQLVPGATLDELTEKAGRVDAAEQAATDAKAAEKVATDAVAAAEKRADDAEAEMERMAKQPGATVTHPRKSKDKNDVEEEAGADAHQKAIDELPHNKALVGHPVFG